MPKSKKIMNCHDCRCLNNGVFSNLDAPHKLNLYENRVVNKYKRGQNLFFQGNPSFGVFCIKSGKIKISKICHDGKEAILRIANEGDIIGHQNIFSQENHAATATVLEDATVCFIEKNYMINLINDEPSIAINIIKKLSEEMNVLENQAANMSHKNVRERLAELLITLQEKYGVREDSRVRINIKLTREEMASMIGTANETIIRFISDFKDEGILEQEGKVIFILDQQKLSHVASIPA